MTVLDGVRARATAPFFDALRAYADRPIGNFHALPIARGHSVFGSRWIREFGRFYGDNIFMAESSSTAGGLDSLLEPTGTIKQAQDLAARCFGAQRTFFVTNGTSTANKIVHMALLRPGDIVLIDRNCHKSHHYGLALAGARPLYLDAYMLQRFATYGGVPLRVLKQKLLDLRREGQLNRVRLLVLTSVTFDGIVYDPERVMEELLAIHPRALLHCGTRPGSPTAVSCRSCGGARRWRRPRPWPTSSARVPTARLTARLEPAWGRTASTGSPTTRSSRDAACSPIPYRAHVRAYATQSTHKCRCRRSARHR